MEKLQAQEWALHLMQETLRGQLDNAETDVEVAVLNSEIQKIQKRIATLVGRRARML